MLLLAGLSVLLYTGHSLRERLSLTQHFALLMRRDDKQLAA